MGSAPQATKAHPKTIAIAGSSFFTGRNPVELAF
jgi:hypothetical protein